MNYSRCTSPDARMSWLLPDRSDMAQLCSILFITHIRNTTCSVRLRLCKECLKGPTTNISHARRPESHAPSQPHATEIGGAPMPRDLENLPPS